MTDQPADPGASGHHRLWLVRHGETEWARLGRHTGRTDVQLTSIGQSQAVALATQLRGIPFADVRSSPRSRALDTARLAGFGDRVIVDDDLAEWDYGADEGRTSADIRVERPGWTIWSDGVRDGETIEEVAARADRVIDRARGIDGDTLCFAHGHILRIIAARWLGLAPTAGALFALSTATVSILGWERETAVILRWNEGATLD